MVSLGDKRPASRRGLPPDSGCHIPDKWVLCQPWPHPQDLHASLAALLTQRNIDAVQAAVHSRPPCRRSMQYLAVHQLQVIPDSTRSGPTDGSIPGQLEQLLRGEGLSGAPDQRGEQAESGRGQVGRVSSMLTIASRTSPAGDRRCRRRTPAAPAGRRRSGACTRAASSL